MASYGDGLRPLSPTDSHRRKSDLSLTEHPVTRQRSGQSFTASSSHSLENRSGPQQGNNRGLQSTEHESTDRTSSLLQQRAVSGPGRLAPRSMPAWVQRTGNAVQPILPSHPNTARVADHHFAPKSKDSDNQLNEKSEPLENTRESRWKTFARSTAYPTSGLLDANVVSYEWLDENLGDYSSPWQANRETTDVEGGRNNLDFIQRRKMWAARFQYKVLHSPMVPLILRMTVFSFCLIALALGGSIRYYTTKFERPQSASTDMAIVVDAVALVYLVYITYDEYTGKPLGLRPARAKLRLIFLDLLFIVFASANLSLAFESLSDVTGECTSATINDGFDKRYEPICVRQEALASVLLIVLIAWILTFAISVLRVVERVTAK